MCGRAFGGPADGFLAAFVAWIPLSSRSGRLISPPPSLQFKFKRVISARDVNIYPAKSSMHNEARNQNLTNGVT